MRDNASGARLDGGGRECELGSGNVRDLGDVGVAVRRVLVRVVRRRTPAPHRPQRRTHELRSELARDAPKGQTIGARPRKRTAQEARARLGSPHAGLCSVLCVHTGTGRQRGGHRSLKRGSGMQDQAARLHEVLVRVRRRRARKGLPCELVSPGGVEAAGVQARKRPKAPRAGARAVGEGVDGVTHVDVGARKAQAILAEVEVHRSGHLFDQDKAGHLHSSTVLAPSAWDDSRDMKRRQCGRQDAQVPER